MIESNTIILHDTISDFHYKLEQDNYGVTINWRIYGGEYHDENGIFVSKDELPHFIKSLQSLASNY